MKYIFLLFVFVGVFSHNKPVNQGYDVDKYSDYIFIEKAFEMKVLSHVLSCECGVRSCASSVIGVRFSGDTIRVLILCNKIEINVGENLMIKPQLKPDFEVSVYPYYSEGVNGIKGEGLDFKRLNTTYGVIETIVPAERSNK